MNFKKSFKVVVAAAAVAAAFVSVEAAAASANVTTNATVVAPLATGATTALDFGALITDATGYTVQVTNDGMGAYMRGSSATLPTYNEGAVGTIALSGGAGAAYEVTAPATVTLTRVSGTETMDVSAIEFMVGYTSLGTDSDIDGNMEGTLDGTGNLTLQVGGTLTVGANQVAGSYTGTMAVTVNYM